MVKYDDKHYEKVAKTYKKCKGSTAKMQDHYPNVTIRTVQRWVERARELGYIA